MWATSGWHGFLSPARPWIHRRQNTDLLGEADLDHHLYTSGLFTSHLKGIEAPPDRHLKVNIPPAEWKAILDLTKIVFRDSHDLTKTNRHARWLALAEWRIMAMRNTSSAPLLGLLAILGLAATSAQAANSWIFSSDFESGTLCGWSAAAPAADCGEVYSQTFSTADGTPWPVPWTDVGGVALADIQGGRARLRPFPSGYSLARMFADIDVSNVQVTFTLRLEDEATQGVGFYVRQNGGYLQQTLPRGEGYAVFIEGTFRGTPGIGVWKEDDGDEIELLHAVPFAPASGVDYRVRFRVQQEDAATTRLLARIWPATDPEPFAWDLNHLDATPQLQGIGGGIAVDSWSVIQSPGPITASTDVDDVEVTALFNLLPSGATAELVSSGFQFTEGPVWRDDHLLFSDIDGNTIFRLDPPSNVTVFRSPSGDANGLATNVDGDLLAAEHTNRRISVTDGSGIVTTLVDSYQGDAFNSPNDIAVRSDGTIYFTDPDYGLPGPRELPFNGLFRRTPGGTLIAEWEGVPPNDQPNGVALSPDEATLYMSDTASGEVWAWAVASGGSLSDPRLFAAGLNLPDGLCIDQRGNLYVATWTDGVAIFSPEAAPLDVLATPSAATNCSFGGDGRDLYVTVQTAVVRTRTLVPGN